MPVARMNGSAREDLERLEALGPVSRAFMRRGGSNGVSLELVWLASARSSCDRQESPHVPLCSLTVLHGALDRLPLGAIGVPARDAHRNQKRDCRGHPPAYHQSAVLVAQREGEDARHHEYQDRRRVDK